MYIPGLFRTGSKPVKTVIAFAPYSRCSAFTIVSTSLKTRKFLVEWLEVIREGEEIVEKNAQAFVIKKINITIIFIFRSLVADKTKKQVFKFVEMKEQRSSIEFIVLETRVEKGWKNASIPNLLSFTLRIAYIQSNPFVGRSSNL
jgi:hypothetical protein